MLDESSRTSGTDLINHLLQNVTHGAVAYAPVWLKYEDICIWAIVKALFRMLFIIDTLSKLFT